MAELLFDWIVLYLSSKYFRNDSRTDRNEQLQLNDTLLDKTRMFYAPKNTPIQYLDPVHTIELTQVFVQVCLHCVSQYLLDGVALS